MTTAPMSRFYLAEKGSPSFVSVASLAEAERLADALTHDEQVVEVRMFPDQRVIGWVVYTGKESKNEKARTKEKYSTTAV